MPIGGIEFHKASTQEWVDASLRDPNDEDGLRLRGAGHAGTGYLTIMYADIPGNSWNQNRLNKFAEAANQRLENRIPLSDPSLVDSPVGPNGADPAMPNLYWESGDLVSKSVAVSDLKFDGRLTFTITRLRAG